MPRIYLPLKLTDEILRRGYDVEVFVDEAVKEKLKREGEKAMYFNPTVVRI